LTASAKARYTAVPSRGFGGGLNVEFELVDVMVEVEAVGDEEGGEEVTVE
jgi:hypothetical protein